MPNWKKVVVSGSDAALNQITASSALLTTADINGGTIDGITSLTAGGNLDIGSHTFRAQKIHGDGHVIVGDGGSDSISLINSTQQTLAFAVGDDTSDEYAQIGIGGLELNYGTLNIPSDLRHLGDADTKLSFTTDKITLTAGGVDFITMTEAASDTLVFGDVQTTFTGHITASGNISASFNIKAQTMNVVDTIEAAAVSAGSLTVDDIQINGSTISDAGDLTLDIGGDLNIDVDGADIILKDGGTAFGRFKRDSSDFIIKSETNNEDIIFRGQDGGATIDALTLDMSEAGAATFNSNITASNDISASGTVQGLTGSFHVLVGDTSQPTSLEVDGHITASGNISSSGYVYSKNAQYWSTTGRLTTANNTTNYYGPNPQGTNYYFWNRDLGTSSTTITAKTTTLNSGWKLPYKAVLTGYHLNIQGRSTNDNIEFTLVYSDGMWDGDVTSTSQTLVEAESGQTVTITTSNNFYELDRRGQFAIPVNAMTMLYPRFRKTVATGGTAYDFQLAVEYYVVQ